jgi:hypothetical protein
MSGAEPKVRWTHEEVRARAEASLRDDSSVSRRLAGMCLQLLDEIAANDNPIVWRNVTSIEDVRAYVRRFPGDGVAAAWDSMLADMDDDFESYELADFLEEGEMQLVKGHC